MPDVLKPKRGIVTFESEGVESPGGKFHSRVLQVPGESSGVTIGRGYDMKLKSRAKIEKDLIEAGVPKSDAQAMAKAAGLFGPTARPFRDAHKAFQISQEVQLKLFEISYAEEEKEVKRISDGKLCRDRFGTVDFDKVKPAILDIFVDMKFRGDYTPVTRKFTQKHLVGNDLKGLAATMASKANWAGVPADRFKRRNDFLRNALAGG
jgi:hypothetical protein